jgi:hypothetical protein
VSEFKKQAKRSMDTDLKEFAEATVPKLEQHLQTAQQLASTTGTRSRTSDTSRTDTTTPDGQTGQTKDKTK